MAIIKKRADELNVHDVLIVMGCGRVVLDKQIFREKVLLTVARLGYLQDTFDRLSTIEYGLQDQVEVMKKVEMTPAQEHADELLRLLIAATKVVGFALKPDDAYAYRQLMEKIKLPEPPTLAETLASLKIVLDCEDAGAILWNEQKKQARDILERACRAGIFK